MLKEMNDVNKIFVRAVCFCSARYWWWQLSKLLQQLDNESKLINWTEQGLTSHQTHYRSYGRRVFTGQMT